MKIRLLFIPLILLISCTQSETKEKSEILSEKKMVDVLVDLQISETYFLDKKNINKDETKDLQPRYYKYIFEKHEVNKEQFDKSIKFYQEDLNKLKMIFDSVASRLELMKSNL